MMWPFSSKAKPLKRLATVSIGDVVAGWDASSGWSFVDPVLQIDCTLLDNDEFHESLVAKIPMVRKWISQQDHDIQNVVNDYAMKSELPINVQEIQGIDMSDLSANNSVDICYTAEEWADFAINVVITDGRIHSVYGGD